MPGANLRTCPIAALALCLVGCGHHGGTVERPPTSSDAAAGPASEPGPPGAPGAPAIPAQADAPLPQVVLCPTPELDRIDPTAVTLQPTSFASWPEMFAAHPDALDYLLTPGDYSAWGPLELKGRDGTAARKRTIRFFAGGQPRSRNPVERTAEARVDAVMVNGAKNWLVHGLTVRAPTEHNKVEQEADRITFDSMLIEDARIYSLRIRASNHVCVQRSVIRRAPRVAHQDSIGIQIGVYRRPMVDIRILANEIYDVVDAIQITDDARVAWLPIDDVRIEGNDLYTSPEYAGCTENGIDLKAGSDTSVMSIRYNRIWGYAGADTACAGSGGRGDAIVMHRAARNIAVEHNTIGESKNAIREQGYPADWPKVEVGRRIKLDLNYIYGVESAFDLSNETQVVGNVVTRSQHLCDAGGDSGYRFGGPVFRGNVRIAAGDVAPAGDPRPCPFDPIANPERASTGEPQYLRRQWTGRIAHRVGPYVAPMRSGSPPSASP